MEQIVYCQDKVYRSSLQKVREKETEEDKKKKNSTLLPSLQPDSLSDTVAEIFQHLMAYREVSPRMSQRCGFCVASFP